MVLLQVGGGNDGAAVGISSDSSVAIVDAAGSSSDGDTVTCDSGSDIAEGVDGTDNIVAHNDRKDNVCDLITIKVMTSMLTIW